MLLNILQGTAQPPKTKNYLALSIVPRLRNPSLRDTRKKEEEGKEMDVDLEKGGWRERNRSGHIYRREPEPELQPGSRKTNWAFLPASPVSLVPFPNH